MAHAESVRLLHLLKPVQRRLLGIRAVAFATYGLAAGIGAGLLVALLARLMPLAGHRALSLLLVAAGVAIGAGYALLRSVPPAEAARVLDREGGEEAIRTALHYLRDDSPIIRMQREEAELWTETHAGDVRKRLVPQLRKPYLFAAVGGALVLALLLVLPNPQDDVLAKRQELGQTLRQLTAETNEMAERQESHAQPADPLQPVAETVRQLNADLKESASVGDALDKMEAAMSGLDKTAAAEQRKLDQAGKWAEQMKRTPALAAIGDSLAQRDEAALQRGIDALRQQLAQMSAEQKQAAAKQLEQLAQTAPGEGAPKQALQTSLQAAAAALRTAGGAETGAALAALQEQLQQQLAQLQNSDALAEAAREQAAALAQLGLAAAQQLAAQGEAVPGAWSSGGAAEAAGAGAGAAGAGAGAAGAGAGAAGAGAG
ncbi:hypothetical protein, partial [Paenibacillus cymbidii]|uniref:hypothetical protein n=1 Tax=Paenibacillus cymbidii TaxID=1639034 RepID=UPI001A9C21DC